MQETEVSFKTYHLVCHMPTLFAQLFLSLSRSVNKKIAKNLFFENGTTLNWTLCVCFQKDCETHCADDQFQCHNSLCISRKWLCDGQEDCKTGEDERNCLGTGTSWTRPGVLTCFMDILSSCFKCVHNEHSYSALWWFNPLVNF